MLTPSHPPLLTPGQVQPAHPAPNIHNRPLCCLLTHRMQRKPGSVSVFASLSSLSLLWGLAGAPCAAPFTWGALGSFLGAGEALVSAQSQASVTHSGV